MKEFVAESFRLLDAVCFLYQALVCIDSFKPGTRRSGKIAMFGKNVSRLLGIFCCGGVLSMPVIGDGCAERLQCWYISKTARIQKIVHPGITVLPFQQLCQFTSGEGGLRILMDSSIHQPCPQSKGLILLYA